MGDDLLLTNARLVLRDETVLGTVLVIDGLIAEVDRDRCRRPGAIDLNGDYVVPGVVELHTDALDKHALPRPGMRWPETAAVLAHDAQLAAAGITTVLDSLAVGYLVDGGQRPMDPRPLAHAITRAQGAGLLRCEHFLHLRCEVSTEFVVEDVEPLAGDALVRLASLMDHSPGQQQFESADKYREYNQGRHGLGDAQIDALIAQRTGDRDKYAEKHRAALIDLCHKHGIPLATHDDATARHVGEAAEAGGVIAEFPTTIEAARAARRLGLAVVAGAPNLVCGRSHAGNVSASELAVNGLIDVLSSDYVPASALHGAFLLNHRYELPLPAAIATVTLAPARLLGFDDRGEIAVGKRADLVRARCVGGLPIVDGVWRQGCRVA